MDSYQHVNNTVYFRYFENGRLEYFRNGLVRLRRPHRHRPYPGRDFSPLSQGAGVSGYDLVGVRVTDRADDRFNMEYGS